MAKTMGKTKPRKPRLLSLCTGIGGIDLAAEWAGFEIAGQCEIDPFCRQVLAHHWPDVKRVADISNVWGDSFDGPIDLVAGGIPCQPWSVAGLRRGHTDDRHLWPAMRRIIEIYQPAWVLVENVSGFISMALDGVCADLEATGYEATTLVLPAAAVGAPHQRERVFIVAHARCERQSARRVGGREATLGTLSHDGAGSEGNPVGHTNEQRCAGEPNVASRNDTNGQTSRRSQSYGGCVQSSDVANTECSIGRRDTGAMDGSPIERPVYAKAAAQRGSKNVADTPCSARRGSTQRNVRLALAGDSEHNRRQAQCRMGRIADGLSRGLDGASLLPPRYSWPAGPGQAQYPWEPPRTTTERIPNRAARLKALGNAVVPQQVYPILAAIFDQWLEGAR